MFRRLAALALALAPVASRADDGVRPADAAGAPLNLDFETGTLRDWTAEGEAFAGQPVRGDVVSRRRGDAKSRHQGEYWVGGFERAGDKPTGTLTSVAFKVTHPWASFLVGGGPWPETRVELVLSPGGEVVSRASGLEEEDLKRVAVDLTKHVGKELRVRLVDRHAGHWGHLNFDDFRFHPAKPDVPPRPMKEPPRPADVVAHAGLKPLDAARAMTVPPGFSVSLFAGEPDVHQPVAFCFDDRGRVWVAEAYVYPQRLPFPGPLLPESEKRRGDRVRVFEDVDGDGTHDKATTVIEGLNLVSGLEWGFGGLWVGAAPYLMFVPLDTATDRPTGPPRVLLDGWGLDDTHETLNSFIWGPDGWLYGCHGVFTHSNVGTPGTPGTGRTPINAGVWRYHPTRHTFEVFAHGTSNPWGLDYNETGDFFAEACVIPHLWHVVQGGRYQRQAGQHFDPHTYVDIPTIATHRHYAGANPHAGNGTSDAAGGGHAHSGLVCYQGGTWPEEYHGKLLMGNVHGHRLNVDRLELDPAAGYTGHRAPDFLKANDKHALFVALRTGPDGNLFVLDWYDKQACHLPDPAAWDRTNGRVYKVSHKGAKPVTGLDLAKCTDAELVDYQFHANAWFGRHARRLLQERHAAGTLISVAATRATLTRAAFGPRPASGPALGDEVRRLKAVWGLHAVGGADDAALGRMLGWPGGGLLQTWALRLGLAAPALPDTVRPAILDRAPPVTRTAHAALYRAAWLAAIPRLPLYERWDAVAAYRTAARKSNPTLDALLWYAVEPLAAADLGRLLKTGVAGDLLKLAVRRAADADPARAAAVVLRLEGPPGARVFPAGTDAVAALGAALATRGRVAAPPDWPAVRDHLAGVRFKDPGEAYAFESVLLRLGLRFGDERAFENLRTTVLDGTAPTASRAAAIESLREAKDPKVFALCRKLIRDPGLYPAAIRGLAGSDDPETAAALLDVYPALDAAADKRVVLAILSSRAAFAAALLDAVEAKRVPTADVPAETVRQLRALGVKALDDKIAAVWGVVRDTPADRKKLIADWAKKLAAPAAAPPDLSRGRAVFAKACQQCHTLYGAGGRVGPDITGANRQDLNYLLENIFDPSGVIPKEYAATKLDLLDGRTVVGIVKDETNATLSVVTPTEVLTVKRSDVAERTPSALSMMPDDVVKPLSEAEFRDLIAYLRHSSQVPLRATRENAKGFFTGKDLAGWDADPAVWRVEAGELVGKSAAGLKRNNFAKGPLAVADFRLTFRMKLTPDTENSGVQFRSEPLPDGEMRGPQADAGAGWWGKLYEEGGRGLLWDKPGDRHVRPNDWNECAVEARGGRVRTWVNGHLCVDLDDPKLSRSGLVGFQAHSGGPIEVRFKDIKLDVLGD